MNNLSHECLFLPMCLRDITLCADGLLQAHLLLYTMFVAMLSVKYRIQNISKSFLILYVHVMLKKFILVAGCCPAYFMFISDCTKNWLQTSQSHVFMSNLSIIIS